MRIFAAIFAALAGLAFGSFLNVCLSRWTTGESIVRPSSHCRSCARTLEWWENIPLASYLFLRGRCRTCHAAIGIRHLIVEFAVGALWAVEAYRSVPELSEILPAGLLLLHLSVEIGFMLFFWLLIALAVLDAEHLWLPDWLTWPGIILGLIASIAQIIFAFSFYKHNKLPPSVPPWLMSLGHLGISGDRGLLLAGPIVLLIAAPILSALPLLLIRWLYWLIRRRQGLGLGDVKLMAMLGAWLGLPNALLALFIGVVLGGIAAVILLTANRSRQPGSLSAAQLPFGTFLCIGGIVSALWGSQIIHAYLNLAGFS